VERTEIRDLAARVDTSAICDASKDVRVMSPDIRCRSRNPTICGTAVTVRCRDDLFGVVQALERARAGQVLVVDGGGRPTAMAGELFARAAMIRGLAGIIIDGACRDLAFVRRCELPVYSRHVTPMAGSTTRPGTPDESVTCGGVSVNPGDVIIADLDGVVVLDPAAAAACLTAAAEVKAAESRVIARLEQGSGLGDCLNVDEHARRLAKGEPSALRFTV
jgi:4-hydroxy-4-methyl-2-oxoglutarate aldolase